MDQISYRVTFMRGGTSKGLFFRAEDLPADRAARERFVLGALGSPDPNGRQLDGMGGGVSSLSKVMVVWRSERPGVDVDYEFGQVSVDRAVIDYRSNCGNLSSAVGVFAVESGLVAVPDGEAVVRMFNTNTAKRVDCVLQVAGGHVRVAGKMEIAGVSGTGAPIRLDFLEPGGAGTGRLLPSGAPGDPLVLPDGSALEASIVDAANPGVFVRAADLGLTGTELPGELRADAALMARLEAIRAAAAVRAGMAATPEEATERVQSVPKIALVAAPAASPTISGGTIAAADCDVQVRMISMGVPHLAIPLTGAMCVGVAAAIPGTLVAGCARKVTPGAPFRIAQGSGTIAVSCAVARRDDGWFAERASVYRTARVLMRGEVFAALPAMDEAVAAE